MKHRMNPALFSGRKLQAERAIELDLVVSDGHLKKVIYLSALFLVTSVCGMIALGVPKESAIGIGIATETVMIAALQWIALKRKAKD